MKKQIQRGYVVCSRLQDKSKVDPSVRLALHHANMSWRMVKLFEHLSLDSMLQTIEKERDKRRKRKRDKEKEEGGNASVCYDVCVPAKFTCVCECSVVSDSSRPHGVWPTRLLSVGASRPEYRCGSPFPPPGDLRDPGIKPTSPESPALQADSLPLSHQGSPNSYTETLMLSVMILGGGAFGKCLGDEGGSSKGD